MKIAITVNTSWNIYNFRMGLVKAFLSSGHEVVAIAPEDEYSRLLIAEGCSWLPLKMQNKGTNPFSDIMLFVQLYKIYKATKPDIVLQFTIKPNIYGSVAAKLLGIPVINNVSGLGTVFIRENWISKLAKILYRFSFKSPSKVFFQNKDDQELFIKNRLVNKEKTSVLPGSGVDLKKFAPASSKKGIPFTFLLIARVLKDKGVIEYAEAARLLIHKGSKAKFRLMGSLDPGPLGVEKEIVEGWVKEGILEYIPFRSDVRSAIAESDCLVLPSYREGTPKTLLEGAAMEKPLIATDVPGCRDVVTDGYNGFSCRVKDGFDLAEKMDKMLHLTEEELRSMGRNSRNLVILKYDENIVIEAYQKAISDSLQ